MRHAHIFLIGFSTVVLILGSRAFAADEVPDDLAVAGRNFATVRKHIDQWRENAGTARSTYAQRLAEIDEELVALNTERAALERQRAKALIEARDGGMQGPALAKRLDAVDKEVRDKTGVLGSRIERLSGYRADILKELEREEGKMGNRSSIEADETIVGEFEASLKQAVLNDINRAGRLIYVPRVPAVVLAQLDPFRQRVLIARGG